MTDSCEHSFWRLIGLTAQEMRSYADFRLRKFDLTVEQLQLLAYLDPQVGQPQRHLAQRTGKSPANITRLLDRLEAKGSLTRKPNPKDRRSSFIYLSSRGERLRDEVRRLFEELRKELLHSVSDQEQEVAVRVLQTIRRNIMTMDDGEI